ncbi:MAG: hypothetical protein HY913_07195 [Desulfomonile tiedjei]|nr:hypothetical protein [Desulfomonile tiedjei]
MPTETTKKLRSLTLEIDGPKITADKFRKAFNAFLDLINEVARDFSGSKQTVRWIVSVSSGSANIHFQPESISPHFPPDQLPALLSCIESGVDTIETSSERPRHFSNFALKKARDVAEVIGSDGERLDSIKIRTESKIHRVTTKTLANVDSIFETVSKDWGSIEGRISEVSERGADHVYIKDRLLNRHIRCHVSQDMLNDMAPFWGRRANVTGFIRYDRDGEIKDIEVQEFEVFPEAHTLPRFEEVYGLFREAD